MSHPTPRTLFPYAVLAGFLWGLPGCSGEPVETPYPEVSVGSSTSTLRPLRVRLDATAEGLGELREQFRSANEGYDVEWLHQLTTSSSAQERVLFVQRIDTAASVETANGDLISVAEGTLDDTDIVVSVGDIVLLRGGSTLKFEPPIGALAFSVPQPIPEELPSVIRPDWDPNITDTPGGCATETDAYRRILLTWLEERGPYILHGLNAHRVRIQDSFTHYHPSTGGFDEFYLVQMSSADDRLLTSPHVDRIEEPSSVEHGEATELLSEMQLEVGDLVYLPRGLAHRGLGGVLAHVIAVPGFRPGAEIGIDHHLRAISERHGFVGGEVPFHQQASDDAVVK